jgi:hypothetical protein
MSEYQYHEWQTVDRVLSPKEQAAVKALSSHMEVSPSKAVVIYNWSDFRHDPKEVLLKYFDAYLYLANWGSLRLMFRFPKGMLNEPEMEPYRNNEYVSLETVGQYQVLDIEFNPEDSKWMLVTEGDLSAFIGLRAALLEGDYRLLYLTWLKAMTFYGEPEDGDEEEEDSHSRELEPPVPPGLKQLSPALQNFIQVFEINPFLVQAAAEASLDLKNPQSVNYSDLIAHLSRSECDDFLIRLAEGDPGASMALRKRLNAFLPQDKSLQAAGKRTLPQLVHRARQIEKEEVLHQADVARKKHIAEMKALARRESEVWEEVDSILENGAQTAAVYNQATALLEQLKQLSEFQNTGELFLSQVRQLAEKFAPRPSLMKRWNQRGWL